MKILVKKNISNSFKEAGVTSEYAKVIYVALLLNNSKQEMFDDMYVTVNQLVYNLTGEFATGDRQWSRKLKAELVKAIEELADKGLITVENQCKEEYVIDAYDLLTIDNKIVLDTRTGEEKTKREVTFENLESKDVIALFNKYGAKGINFLFDYFQNVEKEYYFICTRKNVKDELGVDIKTFDAYIDFLEEKNIIYVYRYNARYKTADGDIKDAPNLYSLPSGKNGTDKSAKDFRDKHDLTDCMSTKGKTKAELAELKSSRNSDDNEAWQLSCNCDTQVVIKYGFGTRKHKVEPQQEIVEKANTCQPKEVKANVCQPEWKQYTNSLEASSIKHVNNNYVPSSFDDIFTKDDVITEDEIEAKKIVESYNYNKPLTFMERLEIERANDPFLPF